MKSNPPAKTGFIALLPTNPPAQRLLVSIIFAICLGLISFALISLTASHSSHGSQSLDPELQALILPEQCKQNVNTNLVNLPGGQLLPSLGSPLNILVMGVDSNGKNSQRFTATRSDTMMLVSIDPQKNHAAIISIPRDSRVPIANGHGQDKINSAHALGGPQLAVETVKQAFNIPVDRYLVVDEEGFRRLLEEVGPVNVLIEKKMTYADHSGALAINLEPGLKQLDAKQAEGYIRFRHDARGDIGRIERQQWFARQITNKFSDPQIIIKLPQLLKIASDCIVTDLSLDELVRLVGFACHTNPGKIQMAVLPGKPNMIHGISYWVPEPEATAAILNKLVNTDTRTGQGSNSDSYSQPTGDLGSAMAYTPMPPSVTASSYSPPPSSTKGPFTVSIRYPQGCEQEANSLELLLNKAGFSTKGKYKAAAPDCQHEQIIENSVHALAIDLDVMHNQLPCLNNWPTVINIDPQANNDLTLVVTPNSKFTTLVSVTKDRPMVQ